MTRLSLAVVLFTLPAFARPYDAGGDPLYYLGLARSAPQEIHGDCNSACALRMTASQVCIDHDATIGVHEVHDGPGYENTKRNEVWTAFFKGLLPTCFVRLVPHGFDGPAITSVSGASVLRACPHHIQACK